ncbi:ROK family protein [Alphaproteobacteria bacterium GH1-50]|uniref:ROK family protein n=2 Tax=Kangsaoukella pontilimi TaxID=2691042 RepID=A0A7C9IFA6_9RHOB|nr:ROK family protein [Kangsaoukella pontilimi]
MILSLIESTPGISRSELAKSLGLSEMAATRIVRELIAADLIEESDAPRAKPSARRKKSVGRPKTGLQVVSDSFFAVGITVSAYHSEVSICDGAGQQRASSQLDTPPFDSVTDAARFYAEALQHLISNSDIDVNRIVGIGVALSARTLPDQGEIVRSEYFGWSRDGGAFCREIRRIIDLPIEIENIANALAISEMRFGAAREAQEFALVHVATFVGASIVSERRVVRGQSGISGLIGHFRSDERDLTCVCGRHDCLNLNATGFGLLAGHGLLDHKAFNTGRLTYYASSLLSLLEDPSAKETVADAGAKLAPALDSIGKLLGPEMIIVSGYLGADETYFDGASTALDRDFGQRPEPAFTLVRGTIASDRAAALLALHAFCYSDRLDYERFARLAENGAATYG